MKKLTRVFALALALLMVLSLVGCSSKGGTTEPTTTTEEKTFTFAIGDAPNYLDPAIATDSIGAYTINQIYFPLYYLGTEGLMPGSAESMELSEDELTYTFKLRENYWSDGQKVTANDFVYGAKHALSIGGAECSYLSWITDYIVGAAQYEYATDANMPELGIVALDDDTIQYTLVKPVKFFPSLLWGGVYYPVREDYAPMGDYTWADTVGWPSNGAFYLTSIDRAAKMEYAPNPNWCWADQVKVDKMVNVVIADQDSQLMAFQNGEIDYASSVEAGTVSKMPALANNFTATGVINYYVQVNCRPGSVEGENVLEDVNVRKALLWGIDRQAICDARDDGVCAPLYGFVPTGLVSEEGDFRKVGGDYCGYDLEKAQAFLAEAGYSVDNPLELEYYYNENANHNLVAAVLKDQLAKVGINLKLKTADVRTFFADRDENGNFQICRGAMSADYNDALTFLDMATETYQMHASWGDETYDAMMLAAASMAGQERLDQLHAAEKYLVEETAQVLPLFEYGSALLRSDRMSGDFDNFQGNSIFWFVDVK